MGPLSIIWWFTDDDIGGHMRFQPAAFNVSKFLEERRSQSFQAMDKCSICWSNGPPHRWSSRSAPTIPTSKKDLLEALKGIDIDVVPDMSSMTKPELRHLFRQHIRGHRCKSDPTTKLGSLGISDLKMRLESHQLPVEPEMTKDAMIFALRSHWYQQCALAATSQPMGSTASSTVPAPQDEEDSADSWEFASGDENSTCFLEIYSKLHLLQSDLDQERTFQDFLGDCQKHPRLRSAAAHVKKNHMAYLSSKSDLLSVLFSCDDAFWSFRWVVTWVWLRINDQWWHKWYMIQWYRLILYNFDILVNTWHLFIKKLGFSYCLIRITVWHMTVWHMTVWPCDSTKLWVAFFLRHASVRKAFVNVCMAFRLSVHQIQT